MGTGYTRQSAASIITGNTITAAQHNNEFNQLESAFNATTGHSHDGTLGEGPLIALTTGITGTLAVANGGTGATTLTDGGILLGSGTGAITSMAVLAAGEIVVGDGTTDPVALAAFTSSTGTLKHESGGLEVDASAFSGLLKITGGATSAVAAPTGTVVGTSDDQILINKTIDADSNTITNIENADIKAAAAIAVNKLAALTASELVVTDASGFIASLTGVSSTEAGYLNGVTSAIQTQLDAKQASDATLTSIAALGTAADKIAYTTGVDTWAETALTSAARSILDDTTVGDIRTTLGVGTGDNPLFNTININNGDTTIARSGSGGDILVEGNIVYRAGGTDVPVTDGGTGASTATLGFAALAAEAISFTGDISPTAIGGATDNYAPTGFSTASVIRQDTSSNVTLSGLAAGADGRVIIFYNIGANNITFVHNATSTAANRFYCPGAADFTVIGNAYGSVVLRYDATLSRWVVIATNTSIYATQSNQESGSSFSKFVVPGTQHYHQSAAKAWGKCAGNASTVNASYGVTSVTNGAAGINTWNWSVTFSGSDYAAITGSLEPGFASVTTSSYVTSQTTTTTVVLNEASNGGDSDPTSHFIVAFGDL